MPARVSPEVPPRNALVRDTVTQIEDTIIPTKTVFHSDRGFQYTSHGFKNFVEEHKIIQSISRVGNCIDNGPMENFWGIIKEEMYRLTTYHTFEELEKDIKTLVLHKKCLNFQFYFIFLES